MFILSSLVLNFGVHICLNWFSVNLVCLLASLVFGSFVVYNVFTDFGKFCVHIIFTYFVECGVYIVN